jgi:hypothetical protein
MLHKVDSTYRELAKYLPELKARMSSSERNKQLLLKMAEEGKNKPKIRTKLGRTFFTYTTPSQKTYDHAFTKRIKKIAPKWLVTKYHVAEEKKNLLRQMARQKQPRPKASTKLGKSLCSYTAPKDNAYDAKFTKRIKKLAPDWFNGTQKNKRQLIVIARKGNPKPKVGTKMGSCLYRYTMPTCISYCPKFTKQIEKIRPDWLPRSQIAQRKKQIFLRMAKNGKPKPDRRSKMGSNFWSYVSPSQNGYCPRFTKQIKKIRPDWLKPWSK